MSSVEIHGIKDVQEMLGRYTDPEFRRRLQDALKAGANTFKAPLRAESARVSRRMGKAVSVVKSPRTLAGKHEKTKDPAVYVGYRKKTAPFAHMVIGGTRDHGPRKANLMVFRNPPVGVVAAHVRGVKPNPIVSRVAAQHQDSAYLAIDRDLDKSERL